MASKELQNLVKAMVKQAYDENMKVTELNKLIKEYREEIGLCKQISYRAATEKEKKFKEEVYDFFSKEISLQEATPRYLKELGHKMSESAYKDSLIFFSEIIFAAKMLANDSEKITNAKIRTILWNSNKYTNYNKLLLDIGYSVKNMREIVYTKWINKTWEYYSVGFTHSPSAVLIDGVFELLKKNGIQ